MLGTLLLACQLAAPPIEDKVALRPLSGLVGSWKGRGHDGGAADRTKNPWTETLAWEWKFQGDRAALVLTVVDGKYFASGVLEPLSNENEFRLTLTGLDKTATAFVGRLDGKKTLSLQSADGDRTIVISLLHGSRMVYRVESKSGGRFVPEFGLGATKDGVAFADVGKGTECIVSGGDASMRVTYKGVDYFVCCSGCRDAFKDDPEKFIAAARSKK